MSKARNASGNPAKIYCTSDGSLNHSVYCNCKWGSASTLALTAPQFQNIHANSTEKESHEILMQFSDFYFSVFGSKDDKTFRSIRHQFAENPQPSISVVVVYEKPRRKTSANPRSKLAFKMIYLPSPPPTLAFFPITSSGAIKIKSKTPAKRGSVY